MPYNKGDFTQQGINGDVSALVRLNEKRVMKVVLSSDDESDNCDISGKVYDLLNGSSYDIGSGVSGNIEITENGENINVAPYATATVNVSGLVLENTKITVNFVDCSFSNSDLTSYVQLFKIVNNKVSTYAYPNLDLQSVVEEMYIVDGASTMQPFLATVVAGGTFTYSNVVNCSVVENAGLYGVVITDPTANASITITYVARSI